MNPAWSIILFTTMAGSAQGLVVALAVACLAGADLGRAFVGGLLAAATVLLVAALVASFFHLGHRMRAWRAALMWRTSWMSREVIVLPAFIGLVGAWAVAALAGAPDVLVLRVLPVLAIALSLLLWLCTAMIYACLRFIQEWAHPLTVVNYTLIGLSSGLVLAGAAGVLAGQREFVGALSGWTVAATLAAWLGRALALRRNAALKPRSTLQSATGIHNPQLVQRAMGMTGGSFNTREFFHRASLQAVRRTRVGFQLLAFAAPLVLVCMAMLGAGTGWWLVALPVQSAGLLAERWFFFAQARHPQNLYYQVVS
ncbi:dimethyl sulfoxide reductase anchor subunit family protein [Variovorax sp. VNK109]|jgi:DMSO reductase anchor subunit|uniref:dimethyl sulfoxide reductase anchor subunit family protein n=1 Tax=Variovorax sp. VNK109 TaxID=3400919 RepID=UPI001B3E056B|nr:dimethyl sulfoxide reductase anchor subunit [Thermomonas sp.]MBP8271869.1 dimethyl sulfoxide reductase anchor subunit [Sphaerotilus sp.]HMS05592.1 dimethyl sulfoxide reductase anchor subunit [Burkholderiaceae bacterium]